MSYTTSTDIDDDFIVESDPLQESPLSLQIHLNDVLLIYFEQEKFLGTVSSIDVTTMIAVLIDSNNLIKEIQLDEEGNLVRNTEDYKIVDSEKIQQIQSSNEDDFLQSIVDSSPTLTTFPEIIFSTEKTKQENYQYTLLEKKEILVESFIDSLPTVPNLYFMGSLSNSIEDVLSLPETNSNDYRQFLNTIPHYLLPVTVNYKKIYTEDVETQMIQKPYHYMNDVFEWTDLFKTQSSYLTTIQQQSQPLYYPTYYETLEPAYTTRYQGPFLMNLDEFGIEKCNTSRKFIYTTSKSVPQTVVENQMMGFDKFLLFPLKYANIHTSFSIQDTSISLQKKLVYSRLASRATAKTIRDAMMEGASFQDISQDSLNEFDKVTIYSSQQPVTDTIYLEKLVEQLPTIKNIMSTLSLPIYNYKDINTLLSTYKISYNHLTQEDKEMIHPMIRKSIRTFKKLQDKPIVYSSKETQVYTTPQQIPRIYNLIMKQTDIVLRNYLLGKFIDRFTTSPYNSNWLHNVYTDEPLVCKHYLLSLEIMNNRYAYDTLIDNWGGTVTDGCIYCKNCQHFLAPENFSLLEGFEGDNPIQTKEVIEPKDADLMSELNDSQRQTIRFIDLLSINMGVQFIDSDKLQLLQLYESLDSETMADIRYSKIDVMNTSYPSLVKAKKSKQLPALKVRIKRYLIHSNQVLFFVIACSILIQTNPLRYPSNVYEPLFDFQKTNFLSLLSAQNSSIIEDKGITYLLRLIKKLAKNLKSKLAQDCALFIGEEKNPDVVKPKNQLVHSLFYLLSPYFSQFNEKVTTFYETQSETMIGYLNPRWNTYNPSPENKTIEKINKQINNPERDKFYWLKTNVIDYKLENAAYLLPLQTKEPIYGLLNIENSDILNNRSFELVYNYVIYLHGTHFQSTYIDRLLTRFIDTIQEKNKDKVIQILQKYGWNYEIQQFKNKKQSFTKLKQAFVELVIYYSRSNPREIQLNDHIAYNHIQLLITSMRPKRIYTSTDTSLFDSIDKTRVLSKLKKLYCYNYQGVLIRNDSQIRMIFSLEFPVNKLLSDCQDTIETDSWKDIVSELYQQKIVEPIFNYQLQPLIQPLQRMEDYIRETPPLSDKFSDITVTSSQQDIRNLFTNLKEITRENIENTTTFIKTSDLVSDIMKASGESMKLWGPNYESILYLFYPPEPGDKNYRPDDPIQGLNYEQILHFSNKLVRILSSLENKKESVSYVPKWWNLTDSRENQWITFLENSFMKNHNSTMITSIRGFNYTSIQLPPSYYHELLSQISVYNRHLQLLAGGSDKSDYTKVRSLVVVKYIFSQMIYELVHFIEKSVMDTEFTYLQEMSRFVVYFLVDVLQEFNDPTWVMKLSEIQVKEKLSLQKEREKLELTNRLDSMTADERLAYVQNQTIGAVNWFQNGEKAHQNYIQSEEFKQSTEKERNEFINKLYQSMSTSSDATLTQGIAEPQVHLSRPPNEDTEGYFNETNLDNENELEDGYDLNVEDEDIMGI